MQEGWTNTFGKTVAQSNEEYIMEAGGRDLDWKFSKTSRINTKHWVLMIVTLQFYVPNGPSNAIRSCSSGATTPS